MKTVRWAAIYTIAFVTVLAVRIGLWIARYQAVRSVLVRPCPPDPQPQRKPTVARITRAVARVASTLPDASCLTQCIAGQALLSWKGIPSTISMGLRTDDTNGFGAHAWLVWNGQVVLEGDEGSVLDFARILDLPTPTRRSVPG